MTATILESEPIEALELDISIKCHPYKDTCTREATWLLIKICGCDIPLCDLHKKVADEILEGPVPKTSICVFCRFRSVGVYFLRWERI